ncbi:uncharacterized protein LOC126779016 [Nymphalis io]|uniref:uncharacterized protein LOC126779016 n=1 Tax=Inachis io TaxID=171585 RepID=UPI0021682B26|nr:uncharacterized protein LOC126779016 [Nymphalis io]
MSIQRRLCLVSSFVGDNPCSAPAPECAINNATHSGLKLPSPTTCNCCPYCLPLYKLGQPCSLGGPGSGITVGRCGDGLTCDNSTRTCVRMKTKCHDAQDDYDARHARGETGSFENRPSCDEKGNFAPFHCVPSQTCYCQSDDRERLFGEVVDTGVFVNMPCRCSRMAHKVQTLIAKGLRYPVFGMRCTSDGNFNPVQCLGDTCYCVNRVTGERRGDQRVNLTTTHISELPCYDEKLDLFPKTEDSKPPYKYTTPCFESVQERKDLIARSIEEGFDVEYFSTFGSISCLPDGTFGRITVNSNGSRICVNERGEQLGDYSAAPNTPEFTNMDCKCAQTANVMASSNEPPRCCKNGNFRPVQCHRGKCRCVDSDGRQLGTESTDVTKLTCYTQNWRNC